MKTLYHGYNDTQEFWEDIDMTVAVLRERNSRIWRVYHRVGAGYESASIEAPHEVDVIRELNTRRFLGFEFTQNRSREWTFAGEGKPMVLRDSNPAIA